MKKLLQYCFLLCFICFYSNTTFAQSGNIIYVSPTGLPIITPGTSWVSAYNDLQEALNVANPGDEIWVAAGTYKPSQYPSGCNGCNSPLDNTFLLKNGVKLYGGFFGDETQLSERNIAANPSILSGDYGTLGDLSDNVRHVVMSVNDDASTVIDGFTITGGNANGSGSIEVESLSILDSWGGGMSNRSSSVTIKNIKFIGNTSSNSGGGMVNFASNPSISNCIFINNTTTSRGGGMWNTGLSYPKISNCTFTGNSANNGGGIFNNFSNPNIVNSILWGNGSEINNISSTPNISYSIVQGGYGGAGNLNQNPLFVDVANGDVNLQTNSPAINTGNNDAYLNLTGVDPINDIDLAGNPRLFLSIIDMGAFEVQTVPCPSNNRLYVDGSATGDNIGLSWSSAYTSLQDALDSSCPGITEIWVAAGTYTPSVYPSECIGCNSSRDYTFLLKDGIKLFGGFNGTETQLSQRNISSNPTILSGDIGTVGVNFDNVYHVVMSISDDLTTALDGFTVTNGNANGSGSIMVETQPIFQNQAGGMYNLNSSPTITNTKFVSNLAAVAGGMYNGGNSSPAITNSSFINNQASGSAGGILNQNNSSPVITNSIFSGNSAANGGAIFNDSGTNLSLINSMFTGNTAIDNGGGIYNGFSSPLIVNNTFIQNTAGANGGAIYNGNSSPTLNNTIIWNNIANGSASTTSASVFNVSSTPVIGHSLIANSGGSSSWQGSIGLDDGDNIDTDPQFVDAVNGDFRLLPESLAVNAGNNSNYEGIPGTNLLNDTDLTGNPRLFGTAIDMGAFEEQTLCPSGNILFVNASASGFNNGSTWADAYTSLQDALDSSCPGITEIWVAAGTYKPSAYPAGCSGCNTSRDYTFLLKDGVTLYGGFAGSETQLSQRNIGVNTTILSGDIGIVGDATDNVHHVVLGVFSNATPTTQLNGFSIAGGNANGTGFITVNGADIYRVEGAGLFARNGTNRIMNNKVYNNLATGGGGGGMYLLNGVNTLANNSFYSNTAFDGGGIYLGGLGVNTLVNNTIAANSGTAGGGMFTASGTNTLVNNIIWGNSGGSIFNAPTLPSTNMISFSTIQGGATGNGNLNIDPLFVNAANEDFNLQPSSLAVNVGSNSDYQNFTNLDPNNDIDLAGNPRLFGTTIDMGAFELQTPGCPPSNIIYVNALASGENDGSSWEDAYVNLGDALDINCPGVTEIWVAAGTYKPSAYPKGCDGCSNPRDYTFLLKDGVSLYGGFAGNETELSQRDLFSYNTTLSGDIGTEGNTSDNVYHVILSVSDAATTVLDGFTVSGGNANGNSFITVESESIYRSNGAGMFNADSSPSIYNATFIGNLASDFGGGISNDNSSPFINKSTFTGNSSTSGGGVYNINSSPFITNSIFNGNSVTAGGGAMENLNSNPVVTNTTITENTAPFGGGAMYNISSNPVITNSILWGNETEFSNNDGSNPSVNYSIFQGGYSGTGNLDQNPQFVDAANGDFRLSASSPAINSGSNTNYTAISGTDLSNDIDLAGSLRLYASIIDMGAFEGQELPCPSGNVYYVNTNANGNNTGVSWTNAFTDLQSALQNTCPNVTEIWVAQGTYYPDLGIGQTGNDRDATFQLINGVAIYGGFTGNETQLSERDWTANETILSGDIDQSGDLTGNSYTLVNGSSTNTTAIIDGFTVIGGNADGTSGDVFNPNRSGGGMFINDGSPAVINCKFSGNTANQRGGGIYNTNNSTPTITNNTFLGNNALFGGGMFNDTASSPIVTACAFSGNSATSSGGGMYNFVNTSPTVINSSFLENTSTLGGGMTNSDNSSTTIINCTFSENLATSNGGALFNFSSAPIIINTIIWNNTASGNTTTTSASVNNANSSNPTFSYSLIANSGGSGSWSGAIGTDGGNNIDANPLFTDATNGDFTLQPSSIAINSGDNAAYQSVTGNDPVNDFDLAGNTRLFGNTIDMGAFESQEEPCPSSNILYVNTSASGNNDGTSWSNAFTDLQDALNSSCPNVTEIWVAQGTYYPDEGIGLTDNDRNATFQLINGVALYGGFTGNETQLSERDWENNSTILSGDINQSGNLNGNSYSILTGSGTNTNAVIDGFMVSGGNADVTSGDVFNPNRSGGGMFINDGSPTVINCKFSGNTANQRGGGIYNTNNSTPTITNNTFLGNNALFGGGMFNDTASSPIVTACAFSGNSATSSGGGMYNFVNTSPTVINSTFLENTSTLGGGMTNSDNSSTTITNCTFSENLATSNGGALFNFSSTPTIINTIIWNNTANGNTTTTSASVNNENSSNPTFSYSLIANSGGSGSWSGAIGTDGGNNIDANPLFTDVTNGDFTLQPSSIAINSGDNAAYQSVTGNDPVNDFDLAGNTRLFGNTIDMGAFESQEEPCPSSNILYVNTSASGNNDGTSWSNAFTDLQDALNSSCPNVTEIWVAQGTYYPDEGIGQTDNDRNATFQLINGVALYGGFTGNETQLSERDWTANETILSGDIYQSGTLGGNSYTVVMGSNTNNTAVLDGFTITKGNANGSTEVTARGAGMFNSSGSPTISNTKFLSNTASLGGGVNNLDNSSPTFTNCSFVDNQATGSGGGMLNQNNSSPVIINTVFSGNSADNGGGLFNDNGSTPSIINTTFTENTVISNGGGMFNSNSNSILTNTIIWNNTANGNMASTSASIFNSNSTPTISYSLIDNSGGSGSWNGAIGTDGGNNIDVNPLFTDMANGDFTLQPGSPAINAGNNTAYSNLPGTDINNDTDLDGNPRLFQSTIDMGAFEVDFNQSQWRGTTSEDWAISSNWDEDVPDDQTVALINDVSINLPRINEFTNAEVIELFIQPTAELYVDGVLKVHTRLHNDGILFFNSDATSTGQLDEFNGNFSGNGEVRVERHIPQSNRAFRYIGSSVNTSEGINANLQEGVTNADTEPNPHPGYGTHITGGATTSGFDATGTNSPSMFEWNEATQEWNAVLNTITKPMNIGEAYALMVRGDRSTDLTDNDAAVTETTLRLSGTLHAGDYEVPSSDLTSTVNEWNLVANPYQALVNTKALLQGSDANHLDENYIYIYDPTLGTRGGYATVDLDMDNPTSTPYDSELGDVNSTNADENLLPNQAFFVKTTGNTPSLTFKENYKNVTANFATTFSDGNPLTELNINLKRQPENKLVDGVTLRFDAAYSNAVDASDADKFWNFDEWFAIVNEDQYLAIEKRALPEDGDEIQLYCANYITNNYEWQIDKNNLQREAVFYDSYLDTETALIGEESNNITFSIDQNIPESIDPFRFRIRFDEETLSVNEVETSQLMLYPNPTTDGTFTIQTLGFNRDTTVVKMFNLLGQEVYKQKASVQTNGEIRIDAGKLPAGMYMVEMNENKQRFVGKLMVE